jgi:C4-dicarboxylate transporter DctM subunit
VNLFVACGIGKITIEQIARKILPFVAVTIIALFIVAYVPQIITFLPTFDGFNVGTEGTGNSACLNASKI